MTFNSFSLIFLVQFYLAQNQLFKIHFSHFSLINLNRQNFTLPTRICCWSRFWMYHHWDLGWPPTEKLARFFRLLLLLKLQLPYKLVPSIFLFQNKFFFHSTNVSNFSLHRKNVVGKKKVILGEKVKTNLIDRADAKVCQTTFFKQIFFFNKKKILKNMLTHV